MSRVQFLRSKRNILQAVVHRFLLKYRSGTKDIYLFFEGKDDPSFYLPEIRKRSLSYGEVHTFQCEGKSIVLAAHSKISNRIDNKHRCLFFIDKDLDNYLGLKKPRHKNIFVTEPYSVENYICSDETLHILWTDLLHLPESDPRLKTMMVKFAHSYETYIKAVRPIMAWILKHRENYPNDRNKLNLSNVNFSQMIEIDPITCRIRRKKGTYHQIIAATNMQANPISIAEIKEKSRMLNPEYSKDWGRGKFEAGWFASFIDKIIAYFQTTRTAHESKISLRLNITPQNILDVFSGRITCPHSLVSFLDYNFAKI